jgi:transcriptional regulator with XRE-family HTH domain
VSVTQSNPTVARIRLAALLREARERSNRSLDDLAKFLKVSAPQASRLDSGVRGFRPADASRLAGWYGFSEVDRRTLVALAEEGRRREWWQQVDLPDAYRTLIGLEQEAQSISEYGVSVVPGLLQTPEYARVVASVGDTAIDPGAHAERIERAVETRLRRQEILSRRPPPMLTVVVDEAVLARGPRDVDIRRGQLEHLRAAADLPHITVHVIGFEYGLYRGPGSAGYILLDMGPDLPSFFYAEEVGGPQISGDAGVYAQNAQQWSELPGKALDDILSRERIDEYLDRLP